MGADHREHGQGAGEVDGEGEEASVRYKPYVRTRRCERCRTSSMA